jgi:hypothetical protein
VIAVQGCDLNRWFDGGQHEHVVTRIDTGHRIDQTRSVRLVEKVRRDHHDRTSHGRQSQHGKVMVGEDRSWFKGEGCIDNALASASLRCESRALFGIVCEKTSTISHCIRCERKCGDRVEQCVESGGRSESVAVVCGQRRASEGRCGQATGIDDEEKIAVFLLAMNRAHRAASSGGRQPIDLTNIIVRPILPHSLELRTKAQRPAVATLTLKESATRCLGDTMSGRKIGVDLCDSRLSNHMDARAETERPNKPNGNIRHRVDTAASSGHGGLEPRSGNRGRHNRHVRRLRLTDRDVTCTRHGWTIANFDHEWRRHAAREHWENPLYGRRFSHQACVDESGCARNHPDGDDDGSRKDERGNAACGDQRSKADSDGHPSCSQLG